MFLTFEYIIWLVCNKYIKAVNDMQPIYFPLFIFLPLFYHLLPLVTSSKTSCRTMALQKKFRMTKKIKSYTTYSFFIFKIICSSFCKKIIDINNVIRHFNPNLSIAQQFCSFLRQIYSTCITISLQCQI